ncbi:MAG: hypothetical protein RR086_04510 [Clostridia bacterium]
MYCSKCHKKINPSSAMSCSHCHAVICRDCAQNNMYLCEGCSGRLNYFN